MSNFELKVENTFQRVIEGIPKITKRSDLAECALQLIPLSLLISEGDPTDPKIKNLTEKHLVILKMIGDRMWVVS